jgi:hypothetical protein
VAGGGYVVKTNRGDIAATEVVVATNGYTGDVTPWLKRRLVPVASHIIATEELPDGMAEALIPRSRAIADTKRVLTYYRLSPDGKRLIFGGRARFTQAPPEVSAPVLHRYMTDRFPQLKGTKITHAWTGNVAFAAYGPYARRPALSHGLQRQRRGDDDLSRARDGPQDPGWLECAGQCLRQRRFPDAQALQRRSVLGAADGRGLVSLSRLVGPPRGVTRGVRCNVSGCLIHVHRHAYCWHLECLSVYSRHIAGGWIANGVPLATRKGTLHE